MKFLDKFALKLFSLIVLVLAIVLVLILTNIISISTITNSIGLVTDIHNGILIAVVVLAILILLSIKGLFFTSKSNELGKDGIVLENDSGKLVISKESLENLIASVTKEIPGTDAISSRTVLDKNKNLIVYVTAVVSKDVMIKDITLVLQDRIKTAMKNTADLDVKEVNIRIKNITTKKVKGLPAANTEEEPKENDEVVENPEEGNNEIVVTEEETQE